MKTKKRQRLCCNCDGEVDLDVIVCPFCAADLREEKMEDRSAVPPSSVRPLSGDSKPNEDPYFSRVDSDAQTASAMAQVISPEPASAEESPNRLICAILFLSIGAQLLVLGFVLALFAGDGFITLRWNTRLWFLYVFACIPCITFGFRWLSKLSV
jgi:hypothetical protein